MPNYNTTFPASNGGRLGVTRTAEKAMLEAAVKYPSDLTKAFVDQNGEFARIPFEFEQQLRKVFDNVPPHELPTPSSQLRRVRGGDHPGLELYIVPAEPNPNNDQVHYVISGFNQARLHTWLQNYVDVVADRFAGATPPLPPTPEPTPKS